MIFKCHYLIFLFIISTFPITIQAQSVRNVDPVAVDAVAPDTFVPPTGNYKLLQYKPWLIAKLPATLNETSGLVFFNGMLWTINDGGNPAEIYQVDTISGEVLRAVVVGNAVNTDWESITQDDSGIYIGDFGNNSGNRTDLRILKIAKAELLNTSDDTVSARFIYFSYPDQVDFTSALNQNNFDCEAFFFHNDSLHLFSKNWTDLKTRHYILPADTGTFKARIIEQFDADGFITDASINEEGNIILLGYKNTGGRIWDCFCWLLAGNGSGLYFDRSKIRIELGTAWHLGQTEGIFLNNDNTGWLSSESILAGRLFRPAKLFRLDLSSFLQ